MSNQRETPILIVEDLVADARLIARSMKKAKIANPIVVVTDGEQAIEYLEGTGIYTDRKQHPLPVLVLLDLKLPKRDGFDVLKWVRQQDGLKRLPIVVLTSSARSPDVNRAYDLGANSYLVKPVEGESLVEMFRQLDVYWMVMNQLPELDTDI
ncbi:CheY-like chemotaxis protein [Rhodopirellula rubra]|uniref:CheY-like chemotaxis protein n=1 Tax=Aporhodopirellula rubra TaxID=980271 RepID=A0A7W5E5L6_9BACT|nr:response regulator [Aporhodopirellula rubra]MBB3210169.1 CheY-like chemotaxis protein [Aporhodopirellula rubra]